MVHRSRGLRTALAVSAVLAAAAVPCHATGPDFIREIQPILAENCYACHGPDENTRKAGLRFDELTEAIETGVITPGDPADSFLIDRITSDDPSYVMPPPESKKRLIDAQVRKISDWIAAGAESRPHWAFQPIRPPVVPVGVNPVDFLIGARLAEEGITPSPAADRETLLRRISFDLTGLPPTVAEMDEFLSDTSSEAWTRVADRLLASPRYGEQMAAGWLDLARFADTFGYQNDRENHVWPWRDWVIRAFNDNLPYDKFITWQLAGDLLPEATEDQILATAFNRLHRQTNEGGSVEEEFRLEYVADRTETFGTAVLGLTLECARCHDHKFDPTSQREFYELSAFFSSIDESGMYSHFTDTAPTPAMALYESGQRERHDELRAAVREKRDELERARANASHWDFLKWLSRESASARVRAPIVELNFDQAPEEGKLANAAEPARPASVSGAWKTTEGIEGGAAAFDGDSSVAVSGVANFERSDPFTISMWIHADALQPRMVLCHRSEASLDAASRGYELLIEDGRLDFALVHFWPGNAIRVRSQRHVPTGRWVHVAATWDGSGEAAGARLFMDGEPLTTDVIRDTLTRTIRYAGEQKGPALRLGARFRDSGFKDGRIDDFRVHGAELSRVEIRAMAERKPPAEIISALTSAGDPYGLVREHFDLSVDSRLAALRSTLTEARAAESAHAESIRYVMVMREMPSPREVHVLGRGDYRNKLAAVTPRVPRYLPPLPPDAPRDRSALARWLFQPDNPLTARVAVNRLWQQLFGRGLVATPEDFGIQGDPPDHPQLLDYLAARYRDLNWDTKAMLREMVLSDTYRRSSVARGERSDLDPENRLLARGPRYRLSAEQIRDAALLASGLLSDRIGGPSAKPYQPEGVWRDASSLEYQTDKGEGLYRRSLYTFLKRTVPPPSMLTFDATNRETCVAERERTRTPLQALVLLNDPQFVEAARVLAERTLSAMPDDTHAGVVRIFRALTSRTPTEAQTEILMSAHREQLMYFLTRPDEARSYLATGDSPAAELPAARLAALTAVAQLVMNFDRFQMKE